MDDRLQALERRVEELSRTVERLEARLNDAASPVATAAAAPVVAVPPLVAAVVRAPLPAGAETAAPQGPLAPDVGGLMGHVGRGLLVFGGAFFIRALTEGGSVPLLVGVSLGLAFASTWAAMAWRSAAAGDRLGATFHGVTAALIGFPLVVEATTRMGALSIGAAAVVAAGVAALLLVIAWRHNLALVGWAGVLGCLGTTGALWAKAEPPTALAVVLLLLGFSTLALDLVRGWPGLRWPGALLADFLLLRWVLSLANRPEAERGGQLGVALGFAFALVALSLGAVAARTWRSRRPLGFFEVAQTALVLVVGLGAAAKAGSLVEGVTLVSGALALGLAALALFTAARLAAEAGRAFDVGFYGVVGLVLVLAGGPLVTQGPALTLLWAGLGLASALLGRRGHTSLLWAFAALLGWAATAAGDGFAVIRDGLLVSPSSAWSPLTVELTAALVMAASSYGLQSWRPPEAGKVGPRLLAGALLLLVSLSLAALVASGVRAALGGPAAAEAGVVLARTLALVGGALLLGLGRRLGGPPELAWTAWISMGFAGLKLLVQDLRLGHASTNFVAFVALGIAVLTLPRLIRETSAPAKPA